MISMNVVFTWLNEFQGSSLTRPDTVLRDIMRQKINAGKYFEAYQIIEFLKSHEHNRVSGFARGEMWLEYGLAYYDMGNLKEAVTSLKNAKVEYLAGYHEHAVALWMLGTVQWCFENEVSEAVSNWKEAIEEFRLLAGIAAEQLRWAEQNWYAERINVMEDCLRKTIVRKFLGR